MKSRKNIKENIFELPIKIIPVNPRIWNRNKFNKKGEPSNKDIWFYNYDGKMTLIGIMLHFFAFNNRSYFLSVNSNIGSNRPRSNPATLTKD